MHQLINQKALVNTYPISALCLKLWNSGEVKKHASSSKDFILTAVKDGTHTSNNE